MPSRPSEHVEPTIPTDAASGRHEIATAGRHASEQVVDMDWSGWSAWPGVRNDFPAAHWVHLRTTNPIESTFATVRHRARQTKGCGSRLATLSMVYQWAIAAQSTWRVLNQPKMITHVVAGDRFVDGELKAAA
jgi:hypothetical protein